jgi:hypothetical protein
MATRFSFGQYQFESKPIDEAHFPSLNYVPDTNDLTNYECITARLNVTSKKLDLFITDCYEEHFIFCRKILTIKPNCSEAPGFVNKTTFSILLNPELKLKYQQAIAYKKAEIMDMILRINIGTAYQAIFQSLWYSFIPCIDVRNITFGLNDMSLLRYCEWRGMPISCSAIFTTFPTDKGLCCSFNMKAADEIFVKSMFRDSLQSMQNSDKTYSFLSSTPPAAYTQNHEPKSESGVKKGLMVLLDSHSGWLIPGVNFINILRPHFSYKSAFL